jgi:Trk K+ transport system NAD-binding subunit
MRDFELQGLHPRDLTRRQRLVLVYAASIVAIVLFYTVLYNTGMRTLEDRPQSIFQSFQTVTETMTTTGYGADSPWETPAMNIFVVTMQVTGVAIGFVTLRVLIIPLFERAPLDLSDRLTPKDGHVVIAEYRRDTEALLDELETLGVDYVLVDSDEAEAKRLSDDGYQAISGDPEERIDLERASIERASLLITDAEDRTASVVLTALEANPDLRVISFTASTRRRAALAEVGVDRSVAPGTLIGQRLAEKATVAVERDSSRRIAIREVLVRRDSPYHDVPVGQSPLVDHPQLALVGGWIDGELRMPLAADERLTPNTVLIVAGPESEIDAAATELGRVRSPRERATERVLVAGYSEGGRAAVEALPEEQAVTTIDQDPETDPDICGDTTEPETLEAAGIEDATTLIVTVDDDATALLTIAMARALSDDIEILARVTETEKTAPAVRAGADYVLSVQRVCARLVAGEVHGERVLDPGSQIRLVRADAAPFIGQSLRAAREASEGWTLVGVARNGDVLTAEDTIVVADDEVFVAGSDEAIQEFERATE